MKSAGSIRRDIASLPGLGALRQQGPASSTSRLRKFFCLQSVLSWLRQVPVAFWRAFLHDGFGLAKAGAYSSVLSLFPLLMVAASVLASFTRTRTAVYAITTAIGSILPPGVAQTAQTYFFSAQRRPFRTLIIASAITLWTSSGVMISWMEGFRKAYQLPKAWGIVKERFIAFGLVIMAGFPLAFSTALAAFGDRIETRLALALGQQMEPLVLFTWGASRWGIAILTSVAVMQLIYHNAVPRTLPWHTVLPGAVLATAIWFPTTLLFAWYVSRYAEYSIFYGSLATAIVLLVWMYILSLIVLVGAEFNALLFPRAATGNGKEVSQ
ncbi:MAG TPA: YihY/virulence factor BrkB family protein [Terriglobales bacterium]|jgi:membrane protein|nr:YihY/virulence factor BrkB family protein [Terriglobales bacterium]